MKDISDPIWASSGALVYRSKNGTPVGGAPQRYSTVNVFQESNGDIDIFPKRNWKKELEENKILRCFRNSRSTDVNYTVDKALDDGAVIGWNADKTGFICLNKNPAIISNTTQTRVKVGKMPGCGIRFYYWMYDG